ncbi:hypothetical protein GCM10009554_12000 [Kribbella koreensis]|uniref:Uncharacterized protein n=1 Tax=Kribbella koreensis TaxID=57909 RepID=A0ABP4A1D8_9ACTN
MAGANGAAPFDPGASWALTSICCIRRPPAHHLVKLHATSAGAEADVPGWMLKRRTAAMQVTPE